MNEQKNNGLNVFIVVGKRIDISFKILQHMSVVINSLISACNKTYQLEAGSRGRIAVPRPRKIFFLSI